MMTPRHKIVCALAPPTLGLLCFASTVLACSALPEADINTQYVFPGAQLMLTGKAWMHEQLSVRLDSTSGPVLATVVPNADASIGPVPITVPSTTLPGYHFLSVSTPGDSGSPTVSRVAFQVMSLSGEDGRVPSAILPAASPGSSPVPTATLLGVFALLGAAGLGFLTAGALTLSRTQRRDTVPTEVRRR